MSSVCNEELDPHHTVSETDLVITLRLQMRNLVHRVIKSLLRVREVAEPGLKTPHG